MAPIAEDQLLKIGLSENQLGKDTYLGTETEDRMGKFRVQIREADGELLHRFIPDTEGFKRLKELIHFYLDRLLEWDLELILSYDKIRPACLGSDRWSKLGWNTWLVSESYLSRVGEKGDLRREIRVMLCP